MAEAPKMIELLRRLAPATAVGVVTGAAMLTLAGTAFSCTSWFTSQGGAAPSEQGALQLLQDSQGFPLAAEVGGLSKVIGWIASKLMVPSTVSQLDTLLLLGPSGTGKSTAVQAAVKLCEAYMLKVTSADVQSHVPGGSERKIKAVFDVAIKLSQHGRCCIVFDQFDTMFPSNGAVGDFLGTDLINVWDAIEAAQPAQSPGLHQLIQRPKPLIIAVTHRLELVPLAVRNRFTESVSIPMPSATAREDILCKHIQKLQREHSSTGSFSFDPELLLNITLAAHSQAEQRPVQQIAALTTGFTAESLHQLMRVATRLATEQAHNSKIRVQMAHFVTAKQLYWP